MTGLRPTVWKVPEFTDYKLRPRYNSQIQPKVVFGLDEILMIPRRRLKREQDVANNKTIVPQK